jgi:chromate transporter
MFVVPDTAEAVPCAAPAALPPPALFRLFARMSLLGFGGVLPWTHRLLVVERRLLSQSEYAEILAYAQLLPGATICNVAVIFGFRQAGTRGAAAALGGMIVPPVLLIVALGMALHRLGDPPLLAHALHGMAVVAAGMIGAMALRLLPGLGRDALRLLLAACTFAGIALLKLPLLLVVATLAGVGLLARRRSPA